MAHLFVADLAQLYQSNAAFDSSQHNSTQKDTVAKLFDILADLVFMSFPPRFKVFKYIHLQHKKISFKCTCNI